MIRKFRSIYSIDFVFSILILVWFSQFVSDLRHYYYFCASIACQICSTMNCTLGNPVSHKEVFPVSFVRSDSSQHSTSNIKRNDGNFCVCVLREVIASLCYVALM